MAKITSAQKLSAVLFSFPMGFSKQAVEASKSFGAKPILCPHTSYHKSVPLDVWYSHGADRGGVGGGTHKENKVPKQQARQENSKRRQQRRVRKQTMKNRQTNTNEAEEPEEEEKKTTKEEERRKKKKIVSVFKCY